MTIPKISLECLAATFQKATQNDPSEFAIKTMNELAVGQPDLMMAVQHTVAMFMGEDEEDSPMPEEVPTEFAKEMICMSTFCVLGLVMKAVEATLEAAELEELYGE